jgi:DNA-directed RNA polymerase subunit RPC12/RpoP
MGSNNVRPGRSRVSSPRRPPALHGRALPAARRFAHAARPQRPGAGDRRPGVPRARVLRRTGGEADGEPDHARSDRERREARRGAGGEVRAGAEENRRVRFACMALIKCSECGREVSDKAVACPSCGSPIAAPSVPQSKSHVRVTRTGARWEGIGFVLIVVGIVVGMAGNPALGWPIGIAGLVVFIVGRFK